MGPSKCGKSVFLTKLIYKNFLRKSLNQDLYQKLNEKFSHYVPKFINPNSVNEDDLILAIAEKVDEKGFEKSETKLETYETTEELKYPE